MTDQSNIQDELNNLNSNIPGRTEPPFAVPDGYFQGLPAAILERIKSSQTVSVNDEIKEISPLLAGISRKMPYSVPSSYFIDAVDDLSFVKEERKSALLSSINKKMPFSVPQGYFLNLSNQVLEKVGQHQGAKIVPLFARRWMRVASAAVIGGLLVLGGLQIFVSDENPGNVVANETKAAPLDSSTAGPRQQIASNQPEVVKEIQSISTQELNSFINSVELNAEKEVLANRSIPKREKQVVKDLLKDVSASEIDAFLNQIPTADEELFVID